MSASATTVGASAATVEGAAPDGDLVSRLRPTRRGGAVVATVALASTMGWSYGARSLNAVVVPAAVLLAVTAVGLYRLPELELEWTAPSRGFAGDTGELAVSLSADRAVATSVSVAADEALGGPRVFETVADGRTVRLDLPLGERGVHAVGPVRAVASDLFGLWERRSTLEVGAGGTDEVVVYPRVHELDTDALLSGYVGLTTERERFDHLRQYHAGDALRDVDWKASAKRNGDLVVTEYAGEGPGDRVTVAVGTATDADAVAEAAASVVVHLLEAGLAVGLRTPTSELAPGTGGDHRRQVLDVLARYEGWGRSIDQTGADLTVDDGPSGPRVEFGSRRHEFADLRAGHRGVVA